MTRCRYLGRRDEQCTAEAVTENADILLCSKHLSRVVHLLADHGYTVLLPTSSRTPVTR